MIVASFGLWFIVVFGTRIALLGNPLYHMVTQADTTFLTGVDAVLMGSPRDATNEERRFIQQLMRAALLQLGMLVGGLALLCHLWWLKVLPALTMTLICKDVLGALIGMWAAHRQRRRGILALVLELSPWLVVAERLSAGVSAVGALVLFMTLNGLRLW